MFYRSFWVMDDAMWGLVCVGAPKPVTVFSQRRLVFPPKTAKTAHRRRCLSDFRAIRLIPFTMFYLSTILKEIGPSD